MAMAGGHCAMQEGRGKCSVKSWLTPTSHSHSELYKQSPCVWGKGTYAVWAGEDGSTVQEAG